MRLFVMAALTAIGFGLATASGAYAAPINAMSIGKSASEMSPLAMVHYRRYYHRHRATNVIIPRPYYYGPYYHGYGLYYGYTRPSTNWPW
jgi:hypothetical protein